MPLPVTVPVVAPAVPPNVTSPVAKSVTTSLKTTVKLIGLVLVGSAWPRACSMVTVGPVVSVENVTSLSEGHEKSEIVFGFVGFIAGVYVDIVFEKATSLTKLINLSTTELAAGTR